MSKKKGFNYIQIHASNIKGGHLYSGFSLQPLVRSVCDVCGNRYSNTSSLRNHKVKKHIKLYKNIII